ncbi:hypothetical protein [Kutzneria kofuensis]|uniref:Uncharacterized protein n=1 Tax=Kutzneria kofuensis TaxID=103725 RepID=A0A7W9KBA4_9PSEU|nr:hypothetical protein [Kutzneria kofuensis]MBB5889439.1 hypothetical protein [Kutzneria kofuensis]
MRSASTRWCVGPGSGTTSTLESGVDSCRASPTGAVTPGSPLAVATCVETTSIRCTAWPTAGTFLPARAD